jgi:uncharacterized NAD-dependent epimerase/dehydratase family protein
VTLGLLHGTIPDGLVLCYEAGREHIYGMEPLPVPSLHEIIRLNEIMAGVMHPCRVIGVAMNGRRLTEQQASEEQKRVEAELSLPVCDVLRDGPQRLVDAVLALKRDLGK